MSPPHSAGSRLAKVFSYPFLLAALVASLTLGPLLGDRGLARFTPLLALTVLAGVMLVVTQHNPRAWRWTRIAVLLPAALVVLRVLRPTSEFLLLAEGVVLSLFFAVSVVVILQHVLAQGRVGRDKILGAVSAYLLIGELWAFLYGFLLRIDPMALELSVADRAELAAESGAMAQPLLYFSFVTLTTLGYGDIVPLSGAARMLTMIEATIGQLFVAIILARLVALQLQHEQGS